MTTAASLQSIVAPARTSFKYICASWFRLSLSMTFPAGTLVKSNSRRIHKLVRHALVRAERGEETEKPATIGTPFQPSAGKLDANQFVAGGTAVNCQSVVEFSGVMEARAQVAASASAVNW